MTILDFVKKEALRIAGIPVLANELDDTLFKENCVDVALEEYFTSAPYEYTQSYTVNNATEMEVAIPDITTAIGTWPAGLEATFVGFTGFYFNPGQFRGLTEVLPKFLEITSVPLTVMADNDPNDSIRYINDMKVRSTVLDSLLPDEMINYDQVLKKVHLYAPGSGRMGIIFGYSLSGTVTADSVPAVEFIRPSHKVVFAKIVTRKFLELIISARTSVGISSDVTLDPTALQNKLTEINERYLDDLQAISTPVLMYG